MAVRLIRQPFRRLWHGLQEGAARARPEGIFLVVALAWGLLQVFIVPPLQVPDEGDHWFRAWALTDGQLTADPQGMLELPGTFANAVGFYTGEISDTRVLPASLAGLPGFTGYEDLFNGAGSSTSVTVASRVGFYGPVGYLPRQRASASGDSSERRPWSASTWRDWRTSSRRSRCSSSLFAWRRSASSSSC